MLRYAMTRTVKYDLSWLYFFAFILMASVVHVSMSRSLRNSADLYEIAFPGKSRAGKDSCCYDHRLDLPTTFNQQYEDEKRRGVMGQKGASWTDEKYAFWQNFTQTTSKGQSLSKVGAPRCIDRWNQMVLYDAPSWHLYKNLVEIRRWGEARMLRYVEDTPGLPRVLLLGDSISTGAWFETQDLVGFKNMVNIHTAPNNCLGLEKYDTRLQDWLGTCSWDLIQFNVGLHYHPEKHTSPTDKDGMEPYREGLKRTIRRMREHSPSAQIVYALTTPSPFDSNSTTPYRETCKYYDLFFKAGIVSSLNDIAREVAAELNVIVNDRYSAVYPKIGSLQTYCDVHFSEQGYRTLAKNDWNLISELLGLQ